MDEEQRNAIRRLSTRFGQITNRDLRARPEAFWALYLLWLLHEQIEPSITEQARRERAMAVADLDLLYGRKSEWHDLADRARAGACDMFDVVLLMPTIVEDLVEMRRMQ
jgi:hypothetical protein